VPAQVKTRMLNCTASQFGAEMGAADGTIVVGGVGALLVGDIVVPEHTSAHVRGGHVPVRPESTAA